MSEKINIDRLNKAVEEAKSRLYFYFNQHKKDKYYGSAFKALDIKETKTISEKTEIEINAIVLRMVAIEGYWTKHNSNKKPDFILLEDIVQAIAKEILSGAIIKIRS